VENETKINNKDYNIYELIPIKVNTIALKT
jgi:hypothetical protein